MSKTFQRVVNIVFAVLLATFSVNLAGVMSLNAAHAASKPVYDIPTDGKITICHRTNSVTNPYSQITVDVSAADGISGNSGHNADHYSEHRGPVFDPSATYPTPHNGDQWGDIIPPVVPNSQVPGANTTGLNWTAAGQAIYYNGCNVPAKDATANVTVTTPTCNSSSVASVIGLANATLTSNNGFLSQTVGAHTATFTAIAGHMFNNNTTTLNVNYTILAQLSANLCVAKDATASVTPAPATCNANGSASFAVTHATLTSNGGVLDKTPGAHTATFTADAGHAFSDGSTTLMIDYTVPAMLTGEQCAGPKPADDRETRIITGDPVCSPNGGGTVTSYTEQRTRTYVLSGNSWVPGPWSAWTKVPGSDKTVPATAAQCPTTVTPTAPTFSDVCGGIDDDTFTIPVTTGVTYYIKVGMSYVPINAGTYPAFGTVTIKAVTKQGYILAQGATTVWTNTFNSNPCPVTPATPTSVDQCGTANDTYTIPVTTRVTYKKLVGYWMNIPLFPIYQTITTGTYPGTGTVTIVAFADHDYTINGQSTWTFTFDSTPCDVVVVPTAPTLTDLCGTNQDGYTIPTTTGATYEVNGQPVTAGFHAATSPVTITAIPQKGYVLNEDSHSSWPFTFTDVACPCVPSTVTGDQLATLMLQQHTTDICTGNGNEGKPATPQVTELPQTGPADGNTALKLVTIIVAGIATYGAMYVAVNRRSLLQK